MRGAHYVIYWDLNVKKWCSHSGYVTYNEALRIFNEAPYRGVRLIAHNGGEHDIVKCRYGDQVSWQKEGF